MSGAWQQKRFFSEVRIIPSTGGFSTALDDKRGEMRALRREALDASGTLRSISSLPHIAAAISALWSEA